MSDLEPGRETEPGNIAQVGILSQQETVAECQGEPGGRSINWMPPNHGFDTRAPGRPVRWDLDDTCACQV